MVDFWYPLFILYFVSTTVVSFNKPSDLLSMEQELCLCRLLTSMSRLVPKVQKIMTNFLAFIQSNSSSVVGKETSLSTDYPWIDKLLWTPWTKGLNCTATDARRNVKSRINGWWKDKLANFKPFTFPLHPPRTTGGWKTFAGHTDWRKCHSLAHAVYILTRSKLFHWHA